MPPATLQDYVKQWLVVRWCHLSISRVVAWRLAQGRRRLLVAWVLVEWYVEHKVCFHLFFSLTALRVGGVRDAVV